MWKSNLNKFRDHVTSLLKSGSRGKKHLVKIMSAIGFSLSAIYGFLAVMEGKRKYLSTTHLHEFRSALQKSRQLRYRQVSVAMALFSVLAISWDQWPRKSVSDVPEPVQPGQIVEPIESTYDTPISPSISAPISPPVSASLVPDEKEIQYKTQIADLQLQYSALQEQYRSLLEKSKSNSSQQQVSELLSAYQALEANHKQQREENEQSRNVLERQNNRLNVHLNTLELTHNELLKRKSELETQLESATSTINHLKNKINVLQTSVTQYEGEKDNLETENSKLKIQVKTLSLEKLGLTDKLKIKHSLQEEKQRLAEQLDIAESNIQQLSGELKDTVKPIQTMKNIENLLANFKFEIVKILIPNMTLGTNVQTSQQAMDYLNVIDPIQLLKTVLDFYVNNINNETKENMITRLSPTFGASKRKKKTK